MKYTSHRLRAMEKKTTKKLIWTLIYIFGGILLSIYVGLPLLAKIAVGLSVIRGDKETAAEKESAVIFPPVLDAIPSATNSASLTVEGYADKDTEIIISVNGKEFDKTEADSEGKFRLRNIILDDGENTIEAAVKKGDQVSKKSVQSIIFKKDPPNLEITEPTDGQQIYGEAKITIKGITDSDARLKINDRLIIIDNDGNFSYPVSLSEGENKFKFEALDAAGNKKEAELTVNYST